MTQIEGFSWRLARLLQDPQFRGIPLIIVLCLGSLCLWRLIRFTILPAFRPNEPKEYPYWIPVLGHLGGFLSNATRLLDNGRLYFSNTREPWAINLGAYTFYVVTRPADITAVYRNTATVSLDNFAQKILRYLTISQEALDKMYAKADPARSLHPNPSGKPLVRMSRDFHIYQLYPTHRLPEISQRYHHYLEPRLTIDYLAQIGRSCQKVADDEILMNLYRWSDELLADSTADLYFGKLLRQIEPDFIKIYLDFSEQSWRALFQTPKFMAKKMFEPWNKLVDVVEEWFASPAEQRQDTVWYTPTIEAEMRQVGISNRDMAAMILTVYWGANTNTSRGVFWSLAHLLFDEDMRRRIQEETAPAFEGNSLNVQHIYNHAPVLSALWNEVLRTASYSSSVRLVQEDTVVSGKVLKKGKRIMMPYRQMHMNPATFGDDAQDFNIDRFLKTPELKKHIMAFGGGATQCPGRHFAGQAATVLISEMLHRFDMQLDGDQKFPQHDETRPVLGMVDIDRQTNLMVRLRPRKG